MQSSEIRKTFLSFFEEWGHVIVPSSSLIPNDPSLLLTNAGMNQFKAYLLGLEEAPYRRAASVQKVFRTSDLENVGHTDRHLTFFEMMGNFSFGDYFKEKAISWAYELVTDGYGIDPHRLWVTVYDSDAEARRIWAEVVGLPADRIVSRGRFDAKGEPANFWWMHVAGPCGPCSEIFVDRGPRFGPDGGPDIDEDRFMEIWNIVFMQDECDSQANVLRPLPAQNIDTGSSLERVAVVTQDAGSVFETDLFLPLMDVAQSLSGRTYGRDERDDVSLRVMAEHGRATTFLIADGVLPSNEGRGYVLRRMLRRVVTHARRLGVDRAVMPDLVDTTIRLMGDVYPELRANEAFIHQVVASEEERFGATYRQGMHLFEQEVGGAKESGSKVFHGDAAFKLHDTYGFPIESTVELAREVGLDVDTDRFAELMEEQRRRARDSAKKGYLTEGALGEIAARAGSTEFVGYERLAADGRVVGLLADGSGVRVAGEGEPVRLVLDRTPFYAEGGGQVGDAGQIRTATGLVEVTDTVPGPGGTIVHHGRVVSGEVAEEDEANAEVDADRREATARSHTATHVLHHTIREFLGEHARQAGSLVAPGRLRFDFSHYEAVPRESLEEVEYLANRRLADDSSVRAYETTQEFAREQGAIALFGEKYGQIVRVVEIGDFSIELCGGTHVRHTGEVALIRVLSEGSIGSGLRRVEALTGPDALKQVNLERRLLEEVTEAVGSGDPASTPERVRQAMARIKALESELGKLRRADQAREAERLLEAAIDVEGVTLLVESRPGREPSELRELALRLRDRLSPRSAAVILSGGAGIEKAALVAALTAELVARGVTAPALLEPVARAAGGSAGGKPDLAMGGGPNAEAARESLTGVELRLRELLKGA